MEYTLPVFDRLPRAIAIDLDGTLLNNQSELSGRSRAALEGVIERGIPVVMVTARPARGMSRVLPEDLAGKCSFVLMAGAMAWGNPPLSGNHRELLPEDVLRGIVECARECDPDFRITIEIDGYSFGTNQTIAPSLLWQRNAATPDMVFTVEEAIKRHPCKVTLRATDIPSLRDRLTRQYGNSVAVVEAKHGPPWLIITCVHATKPETLRRLLAPHDISLDEVLAFGDDLPDAGMLQACGISVAMSNASPEVKQICAYVTASNNEDGVAVVLEEMLRAARG